MDGSQYVRYGGSTYWKETVPSQDASFRKLAIGTRKPVTIEYTNLEGITKRSINGHTFFVVPSLSDGSVAIPTIPVATSSSGVHILSVAPVPARDELTVHFAATANTDVTVQVVNPFGEPLTTTYVQSDASGAMNSVHIPLGALQNGMYTIMLTANGVVSSQMVPVIR
ncbi:MAG: hypothetical protein JNL32_16400 [Candidatus Kapabacteria bacterium]|nr:hypothetical protein [Candidatus Kapabacteria bacterium]